MKTKRRGQVLLCNSYSKYQCVSHKYCQCLLGIEASWERPRGTWKMSLPSPAPSCPPPAPPPRTATPSYPELPACLPACPGPNTPPPLKQSSGLSRIMPALGGCGLPPECCATIPPASQPPASIQGPHLSSQLLSGTLWHCVTEALEPLALWWEGSVP